MGDSNYALHSSRGWDTVQDPSGNVSGSSPNQTFCNLGSVSDINQAVKGGDQAKDDLMKAMSKTSDQDLINLITNSTVSEGARGIAMAALKYRYENGKLSGGNDSGQSTPPSAVGGDSGTPSNTIGSGGDDYSPTDYDQAVSNDRFNQLTLAQKLTRFEQRLLHGEQVNPQRLAETLAQLKGNGPTSDASQPTTAPDSSSASSGSGSTGHDSTTGI